MKKLNDLEFIQNGMVLVDVEGREATITGIREIEGFGTWVEFNGDKLQEVMFDWNRVRDDVLVKDGTYTN
ncbi:hypothetical protein ABEY48_20380 [Bacillus mycoides]|uniref:Uncharacterized protein n=1 Tax=Bacillus cereus TaxID=1396 RepID=A0A2B9DMX6_BACCE|nr:hypothetical protein [Bacillus cereus]MBT2579462.1 hypothetical protein [Bacillus sp. ISL-8]MBT2580221.1 hypothetical protein [Bacillus sp. ISL-8]PGM89362.1 hypothetical protein CN958_24710 [Bacillus cereus]